MALAEVAVALVQSIGIVMLTDQLAPDHRVQALIPRIPIVGKAAGVEAHSATLAFPARDYISSRGWPPTALEAVDGMLYVPLNGEHITITGSPTGSGYVNNTIARQSPSGPPSTPVPLFLQLPLPHLRDDCCNGPMTQSPATPQPSRTTPSPSRMARSSAEAVLVPSQTTPGTPLPKPIDLTADFKPPAFKGAAAVVDFPAGMVSVDVCSAAQGRNDTHVNVPNGGRIVIRAELPPYPPKEIVLDGHSQEIYLSNLPSWVLQSGPHRGHDHGLAHYAAYFEMTDADEKRCGWSCAHRADKKCQDTAFLKAVAVGAAPPQPVPTDRSPYLRTDLECSNAQWP